jgi:fructuronate reductase
MTARLSRAALSGLSGFLIGGQARTPNIGIVHLGLGNFHRAHQALYTEEAMQQAGGDWGICAVNLLDDASLSEAMARQDNLYSVMMRDCKGQKVVVCQSIREVLVAPREPQKVLERLCAPTTRLVSLTVTEKGYCYDPTTGGLDRKHPLIVQDLANPDAPKTVPGYLVAALKQRRKNPFTVLSCDNLMHNGTLLRQVVIDFARELDAGLADWIAEHVPFPCTMVDRITPGVGDAERDAAELALGVRDEATLACETFRQWVIEDNFIDGRPDWAQAGAMLVDDVTPYEEAKLRMLNGTHSTIAYLSMLASYDSVDQAISSAPLRQLIHDMMTQEIAPTLRLPDSFDRMAYRDQLLERYANPALRHRCALISIDGSLKLPPRIVSVLEQRLKDGQTIDRLALAVAAWMRFLCGKSDAGVAYAINDPMADRLTALAAQHGQDPHALMASLLAIDEIFPASLAKNPLFVAAVERALLQLYRSGAEATIAYYARLA